MLETEGPIPLGSPISPRASGSLRSWSNGQEQVEFHFLVGTQQGSEFVEVPMSILQVFKPCLENLVSLSI